MLGANWNGSGSYDVLNNSINGNVQGGAIHMNKGSGTATFSGTVGGNIIGTTGVIVSGPHRPRASSSALADLVDRTPRSSPTTDP